MSEETRPPRSGQDERHTALLDWIERGLERAPRTRRLGSGYQAAVDLLDTPYGEVVIKQPRGGWLMRTLGRLAIRREYRVYERLAGIAGVPRAYGLVRGEVLVLEHIAGPSLRAGEHTFTEREHFFASFLATLRAMHARGVAHGDLKRKDNVLIGPGEQAYLIDFGVACVLGARPTPWNRRLCAWMRQSDYNAWVKLKYRRRLDDLSEADAALYRPLVLERLARLVRVPYQKLTLRRWRQRLKKRGVGGS